jgi:hypothetical protein
MHDPATPYQAAVDLAHDLNGRLLTFEGNQQNAFLYNLGCVDQAGDHLPHHPATSARQNPLLAR